MILADDIRSQVSREVHVLAARCGQPTAKLAADALLPESGALDSAAIIELITWIEDHFSLMIPIDDIIVEKLGSINAITFYICARLQPESSHADS